MSIRPVTLFVLGAAIAAPLLLYCQADARPMGRRLTPFGCCGYAPNSDPFDTDIPPVITPDEPHGGFLVPPDEMPGGAPQFVPGPSAQPGPSPYPGGFVLDIPITPRRDTNGGSKPTDTLNRYKQVADAVAACWGPPASFGDKAWRQVTLRVSFKRDGTINGMPRIPFVDEGLTGRARSDLTTSLMDALKRCTPLPFSPSLGGAVAGQVFALRFIEQEPN